MKLAIATFVVALGAGCSADNVVVGPTSSSTGGSTVGLGVSGTNGPTATATASSGAGIASSGATSGAAGTGQTTSSTSSSGGSPTCPDGKPPCTATNECCPTGWGCVNKVCCAVPCNGACCSTEQACVTVSEVTQCLQTCVESSRCPTTAPCCLPTADAGPNVCVDEDPSNGVCICSTQADCDAGGETACCAPAVNALGAPVGPYVCKPNDGNAYDCCYGTFTTCEGSTCCIKDGPGNEFCALACTQPSDCPGSQCQKYDFSSLMTTCSGPTACGPN